MDSNEILAREPWQSGWQVRLRSRGLLRLFPAAFLTVWLCGWAVGEAFVGHLLYVMLGGMFGLEPGAPPPVFNGSPATGPAMWAVIGFAVFWLSFWTLGGVLAMRELAQIVFGSEVVRWDTDGFEVRRGVGPVRSVRRVRGEDLRQIRIRQRRVEADTRQGRVLIASSGTREEREALCATLRRAMEPWLERERRWGREGERLRAGAWRESPDTGAPALVAGWFWLGARLEPGSGRLTRHVRVGPRQWIRTWQPLTLTVTLTHDSDGDERWVLMASDSQGESTLQSTIEDPAPVHALAEWLSRHTGVEVREGQGPLGERKSA